MGVPLRNQFRPHGILLALAAVVFGGLVVFMRSLEGGAEARLRDQLLPNQQPRPLAEVARLVAALKLVTVEVDTRVSRTAGDLSWRGDVQARVEAPVKLHFGVDLSRMSVDRLAASPASGGYVVRVPTPERIATEVYTEHEQAEVQLGWLRLRSMAGEKYLGEARKGLNERARELVLPAAEAQRVVDVTRDQVSRLVRTIVGEAPVDVVFDDDLGAGGVDAAGGTGFQPASAAEPRP